MDLQGMDKKKIRDYAVKGGIILVFAGILYYALAGSSSSNEENEAGGLNMELPDGKSAPLKEKIKAYEEAKPEKEDGDPLSDYMLSLKTKQHGKETSKVERPEYDVQIKDAPDDPSGLRALQQSLGASGGSAYDMEYDRMAEKNADLETEVYKLRQELEQKKRMEDQLAFMEKSYQLAAKYRDGAAGENMAPPPATPSANERVEEAVEVTPKDKDVVTTLSEELLLDAPYNYGFVTAVGSGYQIGASTIRAAIHGDQTVTAGDRVMLRLLEPLQAGGVIIPRNYPVAGIARPGNDRVDIVIESIEYAGNIIPVSMKVYDTDGMPGLYCPGSLELDALKEGAASIGSGLGTSISFTRSAGQQVAMDLTRGVMTGLSGYVSKKVRTVKVTLKSNYEVLLLPKKNK